MDKTPTHALFTQHYISLACRSTIKYFYVF